MAVWNLFKKVGPLVLSWSLASHWLADAMPGSPLKAILIRFGARTLPYLRQSWNGIAFATIIINTDPAFSCLIAAIVGMLHLHSTFNYLLTTV
jgi:hypothetical protein